MINMILLTVWNQQSSTNFEHCYLSKSGNNETPKHQEISGKCSVAMKRQSVSSSSFPLAVGARLGEKSAFVTGFALP